MEITRLNHAVLTISDLDRVAFYCDALRYGKVALSPPGLPTDFLLERIGAIVPV